MNGTGLYSTPFSIAANLNYCHNLVVFHFNRISISIDVNHTVDAEAPPQLSPDAQEAEFKSRPAFEIDVKVGSRVLSFTCSFMSPEETEGQDQDTVTGEITS